MKRVLKLLQTDGNAELLETIIVLLLSVGDKCPAAEPESHFIVGTSGNDEECHSKIITPICGELMNGTEQHFEASEVVQWLSSFTTLNRFSLMIRFFSKDLILSIIEKLKESNDPRDHLIAQLYSS